MVAVLGFVAVVLVLIATFAFDRRRLLAGRTLRLVGKTAAKTSPVWRFRVTTDIGRYRPQKTVCVSNHCSFTDIFLISHLPWEMKWLAKRSLFKMPFVGWSMWLVGDVGIDRRSPRAAKAALDECRRWLERNVPVMIFPEGTRSPTDELLPFKDGAFRLAIEAGADVLPMAVHGTRQAWAKHGWKPTPARGTLAVGEAISTRGMTGADVERLKATVRERILALRTALESARETGDAGAIAAVVGDLEEPSRDPQPEASASP